AVYIQCPLRGRLLLAQVSRRAARNINPVYYARCWVVEESGVMPVKKRRSITAMFLNFSLRYLSF
ncbi:hypothetical protein ACSZOL_21255, partial [Aeromonas hydrophila]|uniref:hypothetical protein n=1 Tax=Aeromonas hydrophila TaxID=644 RepID=UPI003EC6DD9A